MSKIREKPIRKKKASLQIFKICDGKKTTKRRRGEKRKDGEVLRGAEGKLKPTEF